MKCKHSNKCGPAWRHHIELTLRHLLLYVSITSAATADTITTDFPLNQGLPPTGQEFCTHLEMPVEVTDALGQLSTESGTVDWCFNAGQGFTAIENQRITITGQSFLFAYDVATERRGIEHHEYGGDGHAYSMTLGWTESKAVPEYFTPAVAGAQELFGPVIGSLLVNRSPYQEVGPDRPPRLFEEIVASVRFDFESASGDIRRVKSSGSVSFVPEPSPFALLAMALIPIQSARRWRLAKVMRRLKPKRLKQ